MAKLSVGQALLKAKSHGKKGEIEEAQKLYQAVLQAFPKNKRAQQGLAALNKPKQPATTQGPLQETINQLVNLYNQGQLTAVVEQAEALTEQYPKAFIIWNVLGAAHKGLGKTFEASEAFKKVTELNPTYADGFNNLGVTLQDQGKLEQAIEAYNRALSIKSDYADAYNNMGNALKEQSPTDTESPSNEVITQLLNLYNSGQLAATIEQAQALLLQYPDTFVIWNILGAANKGLGDLDKALQAFKKVTELNPNYADGFNNLGTVLKDQGKLSSALNAYKKAVTFNPNSAEGHNNMGSTFQEQGKTKKAIEAYSKALKLKPNYAAAYYNMGITLKNQGKLQEAIEAYKKAITINPDYTSAHNNMGNVLKQQGKLEEAIEAYSKALSLKPDYVKSRSHRLYLQALICDWKAVEEDRPLLSELGISEDLIPPFSVLALEDAPERHRLRSEKYARETFPVKSLKQFERPSQLPKRLRIGYFSADFHNFAGMHLMIGMLERHDRSKFEIYAFSYGPEVHDKMRMRIVNAVDHFIVIQSMPKDVVFEFVEEKKIDIAIHRNGYTKNSRTDLFSSRLAPIQINYLGYPGTLGAEFMDYIIADPIVIPEDMRQHYSEQIMYLPHTYQPNDNTRVISQKVQTKEDMGLPSDGFVFCCFNNNYKISPKEFDIWMRVMAKVEGSVLWVLKSNKWAKQNLKREAEARGINGDRVIFAEKVENPDHLARHRLADLFLDTFNYNAHTTASDALWAGLPLVTKLGEGFAARVAGSLLSAVGLPELITHDEKAYEALILKLATNPKKLAKIKKKLATNRLTQPLFDTEQYTKHLEKGYQQAYQKYFNGDTPDTIMVPK